MFKPVLAIFVALIVAACETSAERRDFVTLGSLKFEPAAGFVPVEPIPAKSKVEIVRGNKMVREDIRLLTKAELLSKFADTRSSVSVAKKDTSGNLSYLTGTITGEKGSYVAYMDFGNFFVDDLLDVATGQPFGKARIGIGLRLVANIKTTKRGIDLGSLLKIGLAASQNDLSGGLEVRAMGLTSQEILTLLPGVLPAVDEGSIQSALESMAAVKAKIYEDDTTISPRILAVQLDAEPPAQAQQFQSPDPS